MNLGLLEQRRSNARRGGAGIDQLDHGRSVGRVEFGVQGGQVAPAADLIVDDQLACCAV